MDLNLKPEISLDKQVIKHDFQSLTGMLLSSKKADGTFEEVKYKGYVFWMEVVPLTELLKLSFKKSCKHCYDRRYQISVRDIIKDFADTDPAGTVIMTEKGFETITGEMYSTLYRNYDADIKDETTGKIIGKFPKTIRVVTTCNCLNTFLKNSKIDYYNSKDNSTWYHITYRCMTVEEKELEKEKIRVAKRTKEIEDNLRKEYPGVHPSQLCNHPVFLLRMREALIKEDIATDIPGEDTEEGKQLIACANASKKITDYKFKYDLQKDLKDEEFHKYYIEECANLGIEPIKVEE